MKLSVTDAALVKGMLRRGDGQMEIGTWFGVNQARISDVKIGRKFRGVPAAPPDALPPKGPYRVVSAQHADEIAAKAAAYDAVIPAIQEILTRLQQEREQYVKRSESQVPPLHVSGSGGTAAKLEESQSSH